MSDLICVIGAGGHGKVVISTLIAAGHDSIQVFDDAVDKVGQLLLGVPIVGTINDLEPRDSTRALLAIGDSSLRKQLASVLKSVTWMSVVHPTAVVHETVQLGEGSVVFAGAIIQPDVIVGRHCIVNTGATIDHDCELGDYVHIGPGAHLSGSTRIGEGALMGAGSSTIPGATVGRWTKVGAGAVVIRELPDNAVAVGVPARVVQTRTHSA